MYNLQNHHIFIYFTLLYLWNGNFHAYNVMSLLGAANMKFYRGNASLVMFKNYNATNLIQEFLNRGFQQLEIFNQNRVVSV